jgi:hypothetical protein
MNNDKMPYTILALAPLAPTGDSPRIEMHNINAETIDSVIDAISPRLWISLPQTICPEGGITLAPKRIKDLMPDNIIEGVPYLKNLLEAKELIRTSNARGISPADIASSIKTSWPDLNLELSLPHATQETHSSGSAIDDILSMVAAPGSSSSVSGPGKGPMSWMREIDERLQTIMDYVFDNDEWRTFEAAWRGVGTLVKQGEIREGNGIELKIVSISRDTLLSTLDKLLAGIEGIMPNLIIIDIPFDQTPFSQELLEKIASFASTMLVPAAIWITPRFLNLEKWSEIHRLPYLKTHIDDAVFAKWRKLRESPDGNWIVPLCNRFLVRPLYSKDYRARQVLFEEAKPLWISPVWAFAALVAQSMKIFGWPSRFTDYMTIRLSDLAVFIESNNNGSSTETLFSDDRIRQFAEIGITVLCGAAMQDVTFFPRGSAASGESLLFQLFFSRIIGYLIWKRDQAPEYDDGNSMPSEYVRNALEKLFKDAGDEPPSDLNVTAGEPDESGLVPVKITFTPPGNILPGTKKIEFTFSW